MVHLKLFIKIKLNQINSSLLIKLKLIKLYTYLLLFTISLYYK